METQSHEHKKEGGSPAKAPRRSSEAQREGKLLWVLVEEGDAPKEDVDVVEVDVLLKS